MRNISAAKTYTEINDEEAISRAVTGFIAFSLVISISSLLFFLVAAI